MKIQEVASNDILKELSNELLGRYKTAAGKSATAADNKGDHGTGDKRFSGIVKATKKQFNNDAKKHGVTENDDDSESEFANELYSAFEQRYPNLCRKAGSHAIGNAITDFMNFEGQVSAENLVPDLARAIRASLTSVEFESAEGPAESKKWYLFDKNEVHQRADTTDEIEDYVAAMAASGFKDLHAAELTDQEFSEYQKTGVLPRPREVIWFT